MTSSLKRSRAQTELDGASPLVLKRSTGSPSREHLAELSLQNEHYNKELLERLEREEKLRGKSYADALAAASRVHEQIRRAAQRVQEWNLLQIEKARQQQEDAAARELEREKQLQLQREIDERRRRAEEARQRENLRRQAEIEKQREEEEERQRERAREEAEKRAAEKRKAEEQAAAMAKPKATDSSGPSTASNPNINGPPIASTDHTTPSSLISSTKNEREAEHDQYLKLHGWLKQMRKEVVSKAKQNPQAKKVVGDWRREITKCVGQLTREKNATLKPRKRVAEILNEARKFQHITVDVRPCFPDGLPPGINESNCQISGLFIYEINVLAKTIINQWAKEAGAKPETADPPGIMASFIFSQNDFKINGHSLIGILLAKLHKTCPILFGISGNEKTEAGRTRLGWRQESDDDDGGPKRWVKEQTHHERMTGLGAGFASISLRDFSKAPMPNPYPPENYWRAFARVVNTPPNEVTQSHLIVLKALIENSVGRFVMFYGKAAQVSLRMALLEFAKKASDGPAKTSLATLPAVLRKNHGITL